MKTQTKTICKTDPSPGHPRCTCIEAHQDDRVETCQTSIPIDSHGTLKKCGRPATHLRRNSMDEWLGSCAYHASRNYGRQARRKV